MTNGDDAVYPWKGIGAGLTKREYFAAMAMDGMISGSQGLDISTKEFGTQSVKLADALIAELNKPKGKA